jgi:hypothetical protein
MRGDTQMSELAIEVVNIDTKAQAIVVANLLGYEDLSSYVEDVLSTANGQHLYSIKEKIGAPEAQRRNDISSAYCIKPSTTP